MTEAPRLDRVRGFVFDIDGTLVHRGADGRARPQPGAVEVLERVRATGRRLVLFTNGSHVPSAHDRARAARRRTADRRRRGADTGRQRHDIPAAPAPVLGGAVVRVRARARVDVRRRGHRHRRRGRGRRVHRARRSGRLRRAGACGSRGAGRRAAAHRQLRPRLRGRERDHLQPRRDDDRRDRQGHRRPPAGAGQTVPRRARRGQSPPWCGHERGRR